MSQIENQYLEHYKSHIKRGIHPGLLVITTVDSIFEYPDKIHELLAIFQGRIPNFLDNVPLMQETISNLKEKAAERMNQTNLKPEEKDACQKKLVSCEIVSGLLRKTTHMLEINASS